MSLHPCQFPSATAQLACVSGETGACVDVLTISLQRAALVAAGIWLSGERDSVVKRSLAISAAIQLGVALTAKDDQPDQTADGIVPSATAVLTGSPVDVLVTWGARTALAATALHLGGFERPLKSAMAGTTAIELAVLMWAAECHAANAKERSSKR